MRKKQRERLAVYQKHRESLRERERKPFSTAVTVVRTSTSILCQSSYLITFKNTPLFPSTEAQNQESSSYSENESGKRDVCRISYCLYGGKKS